MVSKEGVEIFKYNGVISRRDIMNIYANILELIGNSPLVRLDKVTEGIEATIVAKLEYLNPGGSVKDRIGPVMIESAEKKGLLKPGGTIVEPTSGNTGVGLALAAIKKGYRMIFTMPDKMSREKEELLKALGAEVIRAPTDVPPDDPRSYYSVAKRLVEENENAFSPNQYFNEDNPRAHYETTGPEIWRDTDGKITHFVAGIGTGGTMTGVAGYLKEQKKDVVIVGVDPEGSLYHHEFYGTRGDVHTYHIEGIGEDFMPETVDLGLIDRIVKVTDREGYIMARRLIKEEGILCGSSSGAAVAGALKMGEDLKDDDLVVVLIPDTVRNYYSTLLNSSWLEEKGLMDGGKEKIYDGVE